MKKKGFTLIELLAVIVILAVIALIATPAVLNIINNSKNKTTLRSAELYVGSVENSLGNIMLDEVDIEDGTYSIMKNGNLCLELNNNTCTKGLLKMEINGKAPNGGTITLKDGKIEEINLEYKDKTVVKEENGKIVYSEQKNEPEVPKEKTLATICTYDSANGVAEKTVGAKYSCEVKEGTSYNFYVLTTPNEGDETIDLIMDQNINSDGTPAGITGVKQETNETQYNLVNWSTGLSTSGPVIAMQFLYDATKDWMNVQPITMQYNETITSVSATGYTSFSSTNGVAVITAKDGVTTTTIGSETEPLRARMPISAEITNKTNAAYLYDKLDSSGSTVPYGYWTLASYNLSLGNGMDAMFMYSVDYTGGIKKSLGSSLNNGVRPVISLKF